MARKQSTDLGAGLRGLLLGGSVLFLLLLTIVWLTNRHFEGKKALEAKSAPATAGVAAGPPAPPAPQANTGSQTAPPPP
jgi:hypothetical protein